MNSLRTDNIVFHNVYENTIIWIQPEDFTEEILTIQTKYIIDKTRDLDSFILVNNGTNLKRRPNANENKIINNFLVSIHNVSHIIFIDSKVNKIIKLILKFQLNRKYPYTFSIIKNEKDLDSEIQKHI
ncbi:MAG: hypothetical protein OEY49_15215 [Candidatus Heimdallarchaeota archaeon]|nr:hypothetical protein [Candidatus Heimdallarchaeota archaeon]